MLTVLFYTVQRLIGILKDALTGVFAVGKGHTHAQRNSGKSVRGVGQGVIDQLDLVTDRVDQLTADIHHDHGKLIAADPADIVNAAEGGRQQARHLL